MDWLLSVCWPEESADLIRPDINRTIALLHLEKLETFKDEDKKPQTIGSATLVGNKMGVKQEGWLAYC